MKTLRLTIRAESKDQLLTALLRIYNTIAAGKRCDTDDGYECDETTYGFTIAEAETDSAT